MCLLERNEMDDTIRGAITASILKSNEVWPEFDGGEGGFVFPVEGVFRGNSDIADLYWVKVDGLWGLYDFDKGDYVGHRYEHIRVLTGRMFQVWEGEKWGIIDADSLEVSWDN